MAEDKPDQIGVAIQVNDVVAKAVGFRKREARAYDTKKIGAKDRARMEKAKDGTGTGDS